MPRSRFRSPGSDPRPESGPMSAWGQTPRPRTLPMAELAPVPTGDPMPHVRIGPNLGRWPLRVTHSPPGPRRLAAHLQVPASVPAAPPPKPRGRVMPAEARTSTLAPPKYRRWFGPRSPRGWRVALRSGQGSVWGSRRGALAGCGTRDLTSSLDSRSHRADSGKRRERLPGEASAGAPPPGARLPAAGRRLAGASWDLLFALAHAESSAPSLG